MSSTASAGSGAPPPGNVEAVTESVLGRHVRMDLATISFVALVAQTASLPLLMRYSRTQSQAYAASVAVVCMEAIKLVTAAVMVWRENDYDIRATVLRLWSATFRSPLDMGKLAVPAFLYSVQNNLQYYALSKLDAVTFSLASQSKILATAAFSVWFLHRSLRLTQWLALCLLVVGVSLVQLTGPSKSMPVPLSGREDHGFQGSPVSAELLAGTAAVLTATAISGLAGVLLESLLKDNNSTIWLKNVQLAAISGAASCVIALTDVTIAWSHPLDGFTWIVGVTILNQSLGGLLVAATVRYTNSIVKALGTSIAVVISTLLTHTLLQPLTDLSFLFVFGAIITLGSVVLYAI